MVLVVHPAAALDRVPVLDRVLAAAHVRDRDLAAIRAVDLVVLAAIASRVLVPAPSRAIRAKTRDQRAARDLALDDPDPNLDKCRAFLSGALRRRRRLSKTICLLLQTATNKIIGVENILGLFFPPTFLSLLTRHLCFILLKIQP